MAFKSDLALGLVSVARSRKLDEMQGYGNMKRVWEQTVTLSLV